MAYRVGQVHAVDFAGSIGRICRFCVFGVILGRDQRSRLYGVVALWVIHAALEKSLVRGAYPYDLILPDRVRTPIPSAAAALARCP